MTFVTMKELPKGRPSQTEKQIYHAEVKMFDVNSFKKQVKEWVHSHPDGTVPELIDICEEMIPPAQFASHQWLIEQTVSWYRHVLTHRDSYNQAIDHDDD